MQHFDLISFNSIFFCYVGYENGLIETENLLRSVRAVLHVRAKQAAPGTEHQKDSIKQKGYSLPTGRVSFRFVDSVEHNDYLQLGWGSINYVTF